MRLAIIVGIPLVLVLGWWLLIEPSVEVDPAAQAALPAIEQELERTAWQGVLENGRWFCAGHIIETTPDRTSIKAGMDVLCLQLAPSDGDLLLGSGYHELKIVTIAGNSVQHIDSPPSGAGFAEWRKNNFSSAGQAELKHRSQGERTGDVSDAVRTKAREAFGLPATAQVINAPPPGRK